MKYQHKYLIQPSGDTKVHPIIDSLADDLKEFMNKEEADKIINLDYFYSKLSGKIN